MAAPEYVPVSLADEPRKDEVPRAPDSWRADRPADLKGGQPTGPGFGHPGPDQGYILTLAKHFEGKVTLAKGETEADALAGCAGVALKRASLFGRAPVIHDLDLALRLFGFIGYPPTDLVGWRKQLFDGAAHHYWDKQAIVDRVPAETLKLKPDEVGARLADWRELFVEV